MKEKKSFGVEFIILDVLFVSGFCVLCYVYEILFFIKVILNDFLKVVIELI